MGNIYSDHAKQLDALRQEYGEPSLVFTWNAADWLILPRGAKFKRNNDAGGFVLDCDFELVCTTAQFGGTLPDSGESMTHLGLEYTIQYVTPAAAGYQIRIGANLNAQGM